MKAIVIEQYGGPELLKCTDVDKPTPGPNQLLVRVHAASVTPSILKRAAGQLRGIAPELEFPWIPGADFSGVVEELGQNVSGFDIGDAVFSYGGPGGAFAEYLVVDADLVARKPAALNHVEAASLALVGQTAAQALEEAPLKAGQTLLILGAGGAVGNVAVQLAKDLGAKVIAAARSRSLARLRSLGADEVIDADSPPFESVVPHVDVVLDLLGGDYERRAHSILEPGCTIVSVTRQLFLAEAERLNVRAIFIRTQPSGKRLAELAAMIDEGKIKPFVGRIYPLSKTASAWKDYESHSIEGKIVVKIQEA